MSHGKNISSTSGEPELNLFHNNSLKFHPQFSRNNEYAEYISTVKLFQSLMNLKVHPPQILNHPEVIGGSHEGSGYPGGHNAWEDD
jgi:hypothetical protein